MKNTNHEYTIKTKKIDSKTVIIFGDSKNPDDFYYGKDFLNLKSFEPIAVEINTLMQLYGKQPIKNLENDGLNNINVYHLKNVKDRNGNKRTVGYISRAVPGASNGSINIGVYNWPPSDIYWLPSNNLIENSYTCNKTEKCRYTCNRWSNMVKHEKRCTGVQTIESHQVQYGSKNNEVSKLSHIMGMDFSRFRQKHLVCYDIETFSQNKVCIPVSIAVASTLDQTRYFEKANDTPEAEHAMVFEFMDYLVELQEQLLDNLEPQIQKAISFLQAEKEEIKEKFNSKRYKSKAEFWRIFNYFKSFETLKVFGFNSRLVQFVHL